MARPGYSPLDATELAQALQLPQASTLAQTLAQGLDQGLIAQVKKDRYILPHDANLVVGTLRFRHNGSALLIPQEPPVAIPGHTVPTPLSLRPEDTSVALPGDLVLVRLSTPRHKPLYYKGQRRRPSIDPSVEDTPRARVIRILKRASAPITGTLQRNAFYHYVIPDDPCIPKDFVVQDPQTTGLDPRPQPGDKVLLRSVSWEHRHLSPTAHIQALLGQGQNPHTELAALLQRYSLSPQFPHAAEAQAQSLPATVSLADKQQRLDLTHVPTVTLDPVEAKDFDDALSLQTLPDGTVQVGVHVADVAHYVRPGSALDHEAQRRGNSTYLVGHVVPMLPHALSSHICSLLEGQERLTQSVLFTFSAQGQLLGSTFAKTVIRSDKRLSYPQALALLQAPPGTLPQLPATPVAHGGTDLHGLPPESLQALAQLLQKLWALAEPLRQARLRKGSLDLDIPEVKIHLDSQGYPSHIAHEPYDISHQLIEEWMLLANTTVAQALEAQGFAYISRVHDKPQPEKLEQLSEVLFSYGIHAGDLTQRAQVTALLDMLKTHPQGHSLKLQFLRSLQQARYRAQADGHYGLHQSLYTHFTSPIRRYADLVVHRLLEGYMYKLQLPTAGVEAPVSYGAAQLEKIAQHLCLTEQNSKQAEREWVKIQWVEYFQRTLAQAPQTSFEAVITDLRPHGFFVELCQSMAFGLVPLSSLPDDLYDLTDQGRAFQGRRTGRRLQLGQRVWVAIQQVDRFRRHIDFRLTQAPLQPTQPSG
jgi:ribonuclease R